MKPVEFEDQTTLLGPPPGAPRGTCGALPIIRVDGAIGSFWRPSPEDLEKLNRGAHVVLIVHGGFHPPVWLDVAEGVKELP